jgi:hypothetical protein
VQLVGKSTAPKAMFVEHLLYADAFKGSAEVVRKWEIHFADWLDTAFDEEYSGADWPQDNVLRLKASGVDRAAAPDLIVLANHGSEPVAFLTVKSRDLFIMLDIAPGVTTELAAPAQSGLTDLSWVKVEGRWVSGARLPSTGVNFTLPKHSTGQFKYVVELSDAGVKMREVQQGAEIYR